MVLEEQRAKHVWRGAIFLAVAALLTKVMSAAYRIPYQNIAGDLGFYAYQQIYPFYGMALTLSIYGFPVVISKLVSERHAYGDKLGANQIARTAFYSLSVFSFVIFISLYMGAGWLAQIMADPNLTTALKVISLSFLLIPVLSVLRGYHQGIENMIPTAVSQVSEQGVRVFVILVLSYLFVINGHGPYAAAIGAAIGSVVGGLVAIVVLVTFSRKKLLFNQRTKSAHVNEAMIIKQLFFQGFLICISVLVFIFFQFIDAMTMIRFLKASGIDAESAKTAKGVFDRGQPLLQLGTIVATAFSLALVPMITKARANGKHHLARKQGELALRLTVIVAASATAGLIVIIEPTNVMLYMNNDGSAVLSILAVTILFSSVVITTSAILQGLDYVKLPAIHIIIGVFVKLLLNVIMVPTYGTAGAAVATVVAFIVVAGLNIWAIVRIDGIEKPKSKRIFAILLSLVAMVVATLLWKSGLQWLFVTYLGQRWFETVIALTTVFIATVVLLLFLLRFEAFSKQELATIPKLKKLTRFFTKDERKDDR
ncbi:putative polysaccharide biosynthesis protein [Desertibacillus haloalkaliphilus]|uniref:putative polysaccharide biosynthesis protein n=1 Tax=Desertibacillus haloalkaliphilus TaxID=1328930 RepID=UPI001C2518D2|nr:polysaccharide biosynthesis protein [Desertibacillus haloalkaliphilus]MBU8908435.1 polysaccharide biosynthesis protein [Desertibacillus haloalkaliphilus]